MTYEDNRNNLFQKYFPEGRIEWIAYSDLPEKAIRRFEVVVMETTGTKYSLMARERIQEIRLEGNKAVQSLLAQLITKVDPLIDSKQYAEAACVFEYYSGPLAVDSSEARLKKAAELRKEQQLWDNKQQADQERLVRMRQKLIKEVCDALLDGGVAAGKRVAKNVDTRSFLYQQIDSHLS